VNSESQDSQNNFQGTSENRKKRNRSNFKGSKDQKYGASMAGDASSYIAGTDDDANSAGANVAERNFIKK